ncbi:MAG: hypothetical protein ACOY94_02500 [Bacillota bacterium]
MGKPRFLHCTPDERQALGDALERIRAFVAGDTLRDLGLTLLGNRILDRLDGERQLTLSCRDCRNRSLLAKLKDRAGGRILICRTAFSLGEARLPAILFRELVRLCGGFTLDADVLQHHCYPGSGLAPDATALQRFARRPLVNGYHVGRFVLWDPVSGQCFVRCGSGTQVEPGCRLEPVFPRTGGDPPLPAADETVGLPVESVEPAVEPGEQNWLESPIPLSVLLTGLKVPPEAGELVKELMDLGHRTPEEWAEVVGQMTQSLWERMSSAEISPSPAGPASPPSDERSTTHDRSDGV